MLLRWLSAAIMLAIGTLSAGAPQHALDVDVELWTAAVQGHEPGALDEPVRAIAAWPWRRLIPVLEQLQKRGSDPYLLRSAMLLADLSTHIPVEQRPQLSSGGHAIIAEDGETRGTGRLDSHLDAGRRLLEGVGSDPEAPDGTAQRAHVVAWYRAVSAVLASRNNLADLQPHVERALVRFPDSAGVQFDAGCFAETFASPAVQASLARPEDKPSRLKPNDLRRDFSRRPPALLARAEKHFLAAVDRDPAFAEARVRLARVMTQRGRPAEAAPELRRAIGLTSDKEVKYYAHLFLGNALELSGDLSGAMEAFQAAAMLFPAAQSPQLAISRLASQQGDTKTAGAAVEHVLAAAGQADARFDPWWLYYRGSGRNAEAAYGEFASRMKQIPLGTADMWSVRK